MWLHFTFIMVLGIHYEGHRQHPPRLAPQSLPVVYIGASLDVLSLIYYSSPQYLTISIYYTCWLQHPLLTLRSFRLHLQLP